MDQAKIDYIKRIFDMPAGEAAVALLLELLRVTLSSECWPAYAEPEPE